MRIVNESLIIGFIVWLAFSTGAGAADNPTDISTVPDSIGLELKAEGFTAPLALVSPGDGTGRLFIVDQTGVIMILMADGEVLGEPFLDIRDKIVALNTIFDERGLLGLAFHPDFKNNGRFFVYYSAPLREDAPDGWDHTSHISEFKVAQDNPDKADRNSEWILLQVDQPQSTHNAGQITFGPDGYLYIPLGDGGGAHDVGTGHPPLGNGQDTSTLLGSILRIDVDSDDLYSIPQDNPFVGEEGLDEIFAYGFRNPFNIAFDAGGDRSLFASDAGQYLWEEVNIVTKGSNYGWNIKEGTHCFDPNNPTEPPAECPDTGARGEPLIDPIIEFANLVQPGGLSQVVIGGFVYRGSALPEFNGSYIFGGFTSSPGRPDGSVFVATPPPHGEKMWPMKELRIATRENGRIGTFVRSFGQDADNELYILTSETLGPEGNTGRVFKIVPAQADTSNLMVTPTPTPTLDFPTIVLPIAVVIGLLLYRSRDK
ncbi:glucose/sorbosone dehydrogenase [Candidatus Methanoperedens nitroreducens]|uniref:Glucose/sorbosone dehydrogenase n=1 Tax=Candidatus Methanoperedens nitratireducens TaxID=1392998 RepID=A0A062V5P7_9EURY|nr:PQQ-dependent sugar dehydrogenase [Candidatus Methanoperedens nitroreducens]KCZ72657.1 glucose/sorbosone dehydrogenase [Candidatus Methanoperedens nitroreducens]MDJ1423411.1 PQQ-dependent sugar dehydrogenase [Candidatus Methanoperedens sp.]